MIVNVWSVEYWSGFFPGLFGAVIGAGATFLATSRGIRLTLSAKERADKRELRGILCAIYVEIEEHWRALESDIGLVIAAMKPGEPFPKITSSSDIYYPIYHGNSGAIGRIGDEALIRSIVHHYENLSAFYSMMAHNSALGLEINALVSSTGGDPALTQALRGIYDIKMKQFVQSSDAVVRRYNEVRATHKRVEPMLARAIQREPQETC